MKRNSQKNSKTSSAMQTTRKDPIFTEEDREAEAKRLAACICERKNTTVQCLRCGHLCFGRKFRPCPSHPKVAFLYDIRTCSTCMGPTKDLEELPIDYETYRKLARAVPTRLSV
ncbi:uncharacterized protein CG13380 [Anopheles moucheti]|uniref:uncharacterized protein CG13380 n=1 Tax=Anopheles moucheti TaxID=186751 RepID=UPI0022F046B1|nr:uncharacterized protein CG13380 [Anopheles moucheti]